MRFQRLSASLLTITLLTAVVIAQQDVRSLNPDDIIRMLPGARDMKPGVFCFNPPYGVRMGAEDGERKLMVASLRYHDAFVKRNGAWLFAERKLYVDWAETRTSLP